MAAVQIAGLESLKDELRKFPEALQARATQTGVRKASAKLRTALRRAAYSKMKVKGYQRTNRLRQAIRSAVGKRPIYKGKAWVALKAVPGEQRTRHYYKTLEAGRKPYRRKYLVAFRGRWGAIFHRRKAVGGKYAGSPAMKPFWARTVRANSAATMEILLTETRKAIAFEAGKAFARSKGKR